MQELETLARKYTTEAFLILAVFVGTISSVFDFFTGAGLSLIFLGLGAVLSIAMPKTIMPLQMKLFKLVLKQEKSSQIAIGIARLFVALFLPFIIFAEMGLVFGCGFHLLSEKINSNKKEEQSSEKKEN